MAGQDGGRGDDTAVSRTAALLLFASGVFGMLPIFVIADTLTFAQVVFVLVLMFGLAMMAVGWAVYSTQWDGHETGVRSMGGLAAIGYAAASLVFLFYAEVSASNVLGGWYLLVMPAIGMLSSSYLITRKKYGTCLGLTVVLIAAIVAMVSL